MELVGLLTWNYRKTQFYMNFNVSNITHIGSCKILCFNQLDTKLGQTHIFEGIEPRKAT